MSNVEAKLAILKRIIGDPDTIQTFMNGTYIDHGRHPEAEHRADVLLILLIFVGFHSKEREGLWDKLNDWLKTTPLLLDERNPIEYLVNKDGLSDSLWLGVAFNAVLSRGKYMWVTDGRIEEVFKRFRSMLDTIAYPPLDSD